MNDPVTQPDGIRANLRKTAHDVRTPLTSIAGFAQLLIEDGTLSADARDNAETIREEAKRLADMLEIFFDEMAEALGAKPDDR